MNLQHRLKDYLAVEPLPQKRHGQSALQLNIRNKKGPIFTCIALEPYSVEKESIPRIDSPGEERGTKIKCKTKSGELTIYYSPEDIHNGLKYLKDSNGNIVYGRMVVEKNNQKIRFR